MAVRVKGTESVQTDTNRLVDFVLLIGLNEVTGLPTLLDTDDENKTNLIEHLFDTKFLPQVITTISHDTALLYKSPLGYDRNYPPSSVTLGHGRPKVNVGCQSTQEKLMNGKIVDSVLHHMTFRDYRKSISKSVKQSHDLLEDDILKSLPLFAFPDNARAHRMAQEPMLHYLVLTNSCGVLTYGTCLTFYQPFSVEQGCDDTVFINPYRDTHASYEDCTKCYLPMCCVVLSRQPYFTVFKNCLYHMLSYVKEEKSQIKSCVQIMAYELTHVYLNPRVSRSSVEFQCLQKSFQIALKHKRNQEVFDIPIQIIFEHFTVNALLKILTAVMMEERIVFVSQSYSLLVLITESVLHMLLPLRWRYPYIPVLPCDYLTFLEAPGSFIMGIHTQYYHLIAQIEGLVVVNIDRGLVEVTDSHGLDASDIAEMPRFAAQTFTQAIEEVGLTLKSFDEQKDRDDAEKSADIVSRVTSASLTLMVNLFRNTLVYIYPGPNNHPKFNSEAFLEKIMSEDWSFYNRVLKTDMFRQFMKDRIKGVTDPWTDMEQETRLRERSN